MSTVTMGTNKVFILDKYFSELQKFWDTEKRLQGNDLLFIPPLRLNYGRFRYFFTKKIVST